MTFAFISSNRAFSVLRNAMTTARFNYCEIKLICSLLLRPTLLYTNCIMLEFTQYRVQFNRHIMGPQASLTNDFSALCETTSVFEMLSSLNCLRVVIFTSSGETAEYCIITYSLKFTYHCQRIFNEQVY